MTRRAGLPLLVLVALLVVAVLGSVVLVATRLGPVLALAAGGALIAVLVRDQRLDRGAALPFAPALAVASWFTWIGSGGTVATWSVP